MPEILIARGDEEKLAEDNRKTSTQNLTSVVEQNIIYNNRFYTKESIAVYYLQSLEYNDLDSYNNLS